LLLALADSQVTVFVPPFTPYVFAGLDRPLTVAYGFVSPGLDHPPPGLGDGLRESDMGSLGLPGFGVPGIGGRGCALREGDEYESLSAPCRAKLFGTFEAEDRRRRWEKDCPIEEEEDAEVGVKDARSMVLGQKKTPGDSEWINAPRHHCLVWDLAILSPAASSWVGVLVQFV
jgi:hypothetical protein